MENAKETHMKWNEIKWKIMNILKIQKKMKENENEKEKL